MSNDIQPEIRFPGFTEAWEQRKVFELGEIITGNTPSTGNKDYYKGQYLFVSPADIQDNRYVSKTNTTLTELGFKTGRFIRKGSTLFVSIGSTIGKVGQADRDLITNQQINSIIPSNNYDDNFVYSILLGKSAKIKQLAATQAVPIINKTEFGKTIINVPSFEEQIKIGTFFKQLDDIIALHQRKLDLLKETKKGFLQKMFPKNGAKVPEVRFPGFTEDWEERKFGEIVQVSRGLTYKPSDVQIEGIRVLRSSNINEDVFVLRDDDVFVKPDAVNIAPIKNGDILITSANGSSRLVGKHAIVNGLQDKTVHGGFMLRVKSKNTWFTNSLMSSRWYNYFINIYVSGGNGAIGNLRKYDLESQTIIVPDDEEQQKIGAFFKQLDDTIALHQRKLDLLKETKKGFLQKMFV
ncbi:restriction endonuclease subunit S [Enterococcus faecium]|uniref:restriction endonuclease subunit S n=1 Tax=Enterococcus faecium TaxID=1352 RepID=UPI0008DCD019|nr:restriction endonuclease subunit S [Enterococcus faecium]OHY79538.1 type I restriction endonuclease subunit S [Enterococcus faecium]OHY85412.1 type I restriction endonuclease subunit S [Enterococcus faecium]QZK94976.1 restriction endonuclease subunit S [Enterococcus faecium]